MTWCAFSHPHTPPSSSVPRVRCHSLAHAQDRRAGEHACAATAAPELTKPCARNTFILAKYTAPRLDVSTTHYEDDVLRYGQKIRLIANPAITGQPTDAGGGKAPLCLYSKPVSTTHHAKYSHNQVRSDITPCLLYTSPSPRD